MKVKTRFFATVLLCILIVPCSAWAISIVEVKYEINFDSIVINGLTYENLDAPSGTATIDDMAVEIYPNDAFTSSEHTWNITFDATSSGVGEILIDYSFLYYVSPEGQPDLGPSKPIGVIHSEIWSDVTGGQEPQTDWLGGMIGAWYELDVSGTGTLKINTGFVEAGNSINAGLKVINMYVDPMDYEKVPEPATILLLGTAIIGFAKIRRRKRN